jgi:hypothetical protein
MHSLLAQHLAAHQYLREELQRQFPDADEDLLHDTVEGLTNLPEITGTKSQQSSGSPSDRRAVLEALKAGRSVLGAALGNGSTTIAVRTR